MALEEWAMNVAWHGTTTVQPGNKIRITAPELTEGQTVHVFVFESETPEGVRRSALEIIDSLKGHRLFATPEEVDSHVREERDSWEP